MLLQTAESSSVASNLNTAQQPLHQDSAHLEYPKKAGIVTAWSIGNAAKGGEAILGNSLNVLEKMTQSQLLLLATQNIHYLKEHNEYFKEVTQPGLSFSRVENDYYAHCAFRLDGVTKHRAETFELRDILQGIWDFQRNPDNHIVVPMEAGKMFYISVNSGLGWHGRYGFEESSTKQRGMVRAEVEPQNAPVNGWAIPSSHTLYEIAQHCEEANLLVSMR